MPPRFKPQDPDYEPRVRASFGRQAFMRTLGAQLMRVEPGSVVIEMPFHPDLTQQHGFLHAGALTALVDSACGYAALSLMPPGTGVLSVEFKVNLLAPASAARFRATGRVLRSGRTLTVCSGELVPVVDSPEASGVGEAIAVMQATMMSVRERPAISD